MELKKTLTIGSGKEFKIHIRDRIEKSDIFYEEYRKAAEMLDEILDSSNKRNEGNAQLSLTWDQIDYENNIIAICGDRGEGKSSVMISFIKAVCNHEMNPIFDEFANIRSTHFSKPIVIDPSLFDNVHNVLDIILATLYKEFREKYEQNYECIGTREREELLNQFQKVYRYISLINNQSKMLEDEFDYEGNIGKLSKLGESTNIKKEFQKLVEMYLHFMMKNQEGKERLLIAIDDLDLCSSHAYSMAEQIRKYLIIPNVVIIMALRMEQMQLCVQEQNFINYKNTISMKKNTAYDEVAGMAERYMSKLIPNARRIYMPNILNSFNVEIIYENKNGKNIFAGSEKNTTGKNLLELIYKKTGMKFLLDEFEENLLLPENLRDIVSLVNILGTLEEIDEEKSLEEKESTYMRNIGRFTEYFEHIWVNNNLAKDKEFDKLMRRGYVQLNKNVIRSLKENYLEKTEIFDLKRRKPALDFEYSFTEGIRLLSFLEEESLTDEVRIHMYAIRVLYTIRMNELFRMNKYDEITRILNGYVWADDFSDMIQKMQEPEKSRARFRLPIVTAFRLISTELFNKEDDFFSKTIKDQYYVTKISDDKKDEQLLTWTLIGMFMNSCEKNNQKLSVKQFIASNSRILSYTQVSLENYIISLCDLHSLYEKINMEKLGIEKDEFDKLIEILEKYNEKKINVFRKIIFNTDVLLQIKEYCADKKQLKEGYQSEYERTKGAIELYFKNILKFMQEKFEEYKDLLMEDLAIFSLGQNRSANIIDLYSTFVMNGIDLERSEESKKKMMNYRNF